MERTELTNMCMIEDPITGKVLVQNRIKGSWTGIAFPGGHLEEGESIVDSTIREIYEETGLKISDLTMVGVKNWYSDSPQVEERYRYIVFLFTATSFEGQLIEGGEEGEVFWVHKEELPTMKLARGFGEMLEVFIKPNVNEHYTFIDQTGQQTFCLK